MPAKEELRQTVRDRLDAIIAEVNAALRGENLNTMKKGLERTGRNRQLPHWFQKLRTDGTLPNLDGKTIGSVVEMLLVGEVKHVVARFTVNSDKLCVVEGFNQRGRNKAKVKRRLATTRTTREVGTLAGELGEFVGLDRAVQNAYDE